MSNEEQSIAGGGWDIGNSRVLIIVPAHNEAESLPQLLSLLRTACSNCDVVVIDDGSTDSTRMVVQPLARVVSLPCNLGIGGAVQTGLLIALQEGYDFAVQVDGDGQHPPQEVVRLFRALHESAADMVIGSRFQTEGGYKSTPPRRFGILMFSWFLSLICRTRITDATSGFRVMNRRAISVLSRCYPEDYPEVEALMIAHRAGLRIADTPVRMAQRFAGTSSINWLKAIGYMLKVPFAICMGLLRKPELHPFE